MFISLKHTIQQKPRSFLFTVLQADNRCDAAFRSEWDPAKNDANKRKHGLRFEDAKPLFIWEAERLDQRDEEHSTSEDRFISVGPIASYYE